MKITEKTYVADILNEYGDIANVMEIFGIKRVGGYKLRKFLARFITVRTAALIHGVPKDKFIEMLMDALKTSGRTEKL